MARPHTQVKLLAAEIEEVETVGERQHRAAAAANRQGSDVVIERPVARPARARVETPDRRVAHATPRAVQPVQATVFDVPDRTFAEMVRALDHALDLQWAFSAERAPARMFGRL